MTIKRKTALSAFILVFIVLFVSACTTVNDPTVSPDPTPIPEIEVLMQNNTGHISAGDVHTVGLSADGVLYVAGRSTHGQLDAMFIGGIVQSVSRGNTIAALKTDGSVLVFGENAELFSEALQWSNIVKLAMGDKHIIGLTQKGRLLSCGDNSDGQCNVSNLHSITDISAAANHTVALTESGNVLAIGDPTDGKCSTLEWNDVVSIAACDTYTAALTGEGSVLITGDNTVDGFNSAETLFSSGDYIYAHGNNGEFYIYPECAELNGYTDIAHVAFGKNHIAIMHNNGTVEGIGETDNKQCDTSIWDLRLHIEDGYITGFAPNTDIIEATELIGFESSGDIAFTRNGSTVSDGVVSTGMTVTQNGESIGEVLIYGDIDCDGDITEADVSLLNSHINNESELTGIALLAADVLHYPGETAVLDERHVSAIENHIAGTGNIAQYIYNPYRDEVAEHYAINSDVVGWISFDGTIIDYPLLYGDEYYYHERDIYKEHYNGGCIYPLYHKLFKVNPIAGHNMRVSGKMFHELHDLQENAEDFLVYKNRIIGIQLHEGYSEWEIFAIYETESDEPATTMRYNMNRMTDFTDEDIREWIDTQLSRSEIDLGVEVSIDDTFLFTYTCGDYYDSDQSNQARLYFFMRKVF